MSTDINVKVDLGGLLAQNRAQTAANRFAFLEGQEDKRLAAAAAAANAARQEETGNDGAGRPLYWGNMRSGQFQEELAASRGDEGAFLIIHNTSTPLSVTAFPESFNFPDYFNARVDSQQTYAYYQGILPDDFILNFGDPEIPEQLGFIGNLDFDNYDEPVYFLILWPRADRRIIQRLIPPGWTLGGVFNVRGTGLKLEQPYAWALQSLENKLNNAIIPVTGFSTLIPYQIRYRLVWGYAIGGTLNRVRRFTFFNPNNQDQYRGNFYGFPSDQLVFEKEPVFRDEWLLPFPAWTNNYAISP
jgi:hypothetical protein